MPGWIVTGTDTEIGKTMVTCSLLREARALGHSILGLKPFCSGNRDDAIQLQAASSIKLALDQINPFWWQAPLCPLAAGALEKYPLPNKALREYLQWLQRVASENPWVLVEGIGGWEVPIGDHYRWSHFARDVQFPVLLVVANRLGALNHTLLTVEVIQSQGLECAGIILNYPTAQPDAASQTNRKILETELDIPILGELPYGASSIHWHQHSLFAKNAA